MQPDTTCKRNQNLAKGVGLNKKLKYFCSENVTLRWSAEQTGASRAYYRRGSPLEVLGVWRKAPTRLTLFAIFQPKIAIFSH